MLPNLLTRRLLKTSRLRLRIMSVGLDGVDVCVAVGVRLRACKCVPRKQERAPVRATDGYDGMRRSSYTTNGGELAAETRL